MTENDIQELKCLKDLIKKILVKDPDERISLKEIKVHPFTTFDLSELEKKKFFKFNQNIFKAEDCKKNLMLRKQFLLHLHNLQVCQKDQEFVFKQTACCYYCYHYHFSTSSNYITVNTRKFIPETHTKQFEI